MTFEKLIKARRILIIILSILMLAGVALTFCNSAIGIFIWLFSILYFILFEIITYGIGDVKYVSKDARYRPLYYDNKFSLTGFRENFFGLRLYKHSKNIGDKLTTKFYNQSIIGFALIALQIICMVTILFFLGELEL